MALREMYPAAVNSVPTMLVGLLSATATAVDVENAAVLPEGPSIATLGTEDNAELVYYGAIVGNRLTGCVRGYGGTAAQIWPAGTLVYRAYTVVDHERFCENILDLDERKVDDTGTINNTKATFVGAAYRSNLAPGERMSTLLGKLYRWYVDFGAGAWAGFGKAAGTIAEGNHGHDGYVPVDGDGKARAQALSAGSVRVTASRALVAGDAGRCLDVDAGTAVTVTIPEDAEASLPADTEIEIAWEGSGAVRIVPAAGVTLMSTKGRMDDGTELATRYAVCVLKKKAANDWRITGEIA